MKSYIILMLTLSIFATSNGNAQTVENIQKTEKSIRNNGKYALLVMKVQHLKAAIQTGIEFKTKSKKIDVQVVTCGELVKEISKNPDLQNFIKQAVNQHKLKILICGLSIKQFEVDKNLLPKETPITENGLIYTFGLQENGYKVIVL
ncbi:hypothetical protein GV828_08065 [Flavobacterium sp. NST-5]|uniref:Sulfur reduction protein DsrE n=1 Tax=Flavobacterium ichthyis TaxID=2698827 RepID=A0ABW9Z8D2_9FLAO|nr:DsrE family protein [Flavobacterium ichthyis]NBL65151.1 hypothetical protein [Flavobacterium ichthyis]